jgi:hypothetical protein
MERLPHLAKNERDMGHPSAPWSGQCFGLGPRRRSGFPGEVVAVNHASGTFEVKAIPQAPNGEASIVGRMSLEKQFQGDLAATSKVEMLTAMTQVKGSAGYVAIEWVSGALDGRNGGFALQHSGTMTRGVPQMTVTVVPDSGTEELTGLAGSMTIKITDGKHFYDFEYTTTQVS